jgi:DNA replication protein DnaC
VQPVDLAVYDSLIQGDGHHECQFKPDYYLRQITPVAKFRQVSVDCQRSGTEPLGIQDFLLTLMKHEVENRQENRRKTRIKKAKFPFIKTLDTHNFKNLPNVGPAVIWQLADCSFIERKEGVVIIGPPGTGKTHTAIGLGLQACQKGYNVRFYTAAGLVNQLLEAQNHHRFSKLEKCLSKIHLLILDELSYLTFSRPSAEQLFQVLSARNEHPA